jgi:hypothetical protein
LLVKQTGLSQDSLRPHVIIYAPRSHISDLLISQKCLGATVDIKSKNFEDYTKAKTVVVKLYKKTIKKMKNPPTLCMIECLTTVAK